MRTTGTITFVNSANSFGFIRCEGGERDCFLPKGAIRHGHGALLRAGDCIEFEVVPGAWGPQASNVVKL